jgi:hypothetical protein
MSGIAGASLSTFATWAALILTGILTGTLVSRWSASDRTLNPRTGTLALGAAAAGVVAWFAQVGALVGNAASNPLLTAFVPMETSPGFRVAVLWATLPGGALTFAVSLLVVVALTTPWRGGDRLRFLGVLAVAALAALLLSVWFAPEPNVASTRLPVFVQATSAAMAPLVALLALVVLTVGVAAAIAGAPPAKPLLLGAWIAATIALAAEQLARGELGIGPRDAVALGNAASGLVFWLLTSALLHRRVQGLLVRATPDRTASATSRAANAAHAGAVLMVVSFALHALAARSTVSVAAGATVEVTDAFHQPWQLANQGVSRFDAEGMDVLSVAIESTDPRGTLRLVAPAIQDPHARDGRHLDNTISRRVSAASALQSMRVLLLEVDSLDVARVRVTFLPVPILWPMGVALLVLSAALSLFDERRSRQPTG